MLCWNMSLVSSSRASCFHVHASRAPGVRRRPLLSLSISKHLALNINIKQPGRVGVGNQNTLSTSAGSLLHLKYQNRRHSRRQGMLKFSAFGPRSAASLLLTAGRQDQQQRFVSTVSSACVPNRNFANSQCCSKFAILGIRNFTYLLQFSIANSQFRSKFVIL